ncbi:MAG TPA: hypothetical protein PLD83_06910 [Oscillospiraceae bacterium]|nr:hypothetical protein [Oscillospiraceae bacterium]HNY00057.1 hypothetical protein [Oscillospiraceae bacterium]HPS76153.1 hypothetical protein [Oscillospiraceae bacterium]
MCKFGKFLKKFLHLAVGLYALLFAVFYFDLDGKLLFYVVEPFLCKHYDDMPRKDVLKTEYSMDKFPKYEYGK